MKFTAQTAYRSTDSILKDPIDQSLVTEADAEHMYARRDHTRATRPTWHENLSESKRTPQHSRRMSRCMSAHRQSTSQCPEIPPEHMRGGSRCPGPAVEPERARWHDPVLGRRLGLTPADTHISPSNLMGILGAKRMAGG
jgi:hypothetical protein